MWLCSGVLTLKATAGKELLAGSSFMLVLRSGLVEVLDKDAPLVVSMVEDSDCCRSMWTGD